MNDSIEDQKTTTNADAQRPNEGVVMWRKLLGLLDVDWSNRRWDITQSILLGANFALMPLAQNGWYFSINLIAVLMTINGLLKRNKAT